MTRSSGALVSLLALSLLSASAQPAPLTVSVASSLADVMAEIGRAFQRQGGPALTLNIGSSNTLARQIVQGAPADVFMSADEAQMDVVDRAGHLVSGSRRNLLSNALVVVVPKGAPPIVAKPADLTSTAVKRIAMGNPDIVPAGVYGRQWLERIGLWNALSTRVVPASTVRAALAAVGAERAEAGIVYATDARTATDVRVAFTVPPADAPPIRYPVAAVRGRREADAARLIEFLGSDVAAKIFESAGFIVIRP